jgi:crossover junction endodeoxyribonuclease RusA
MSRLQFRVLGVPAPQGSKRHVGNGRMIEMSKLLPGWRDAVTTSAWQAAHDWGDAGWDAPREVGVEVEFLFRRPKHHYRTGRNAHLLRPNAPMWHSTKPDLDKLQRSLFDALTNAAVIGDDCQIVSVRAHKFYADDLNPPGAFVSIYPAEEERA